ncbi:hypothetical protein GCM10022222_70150 [Amycolatopsis ultiminotia]|uniref:Uncharacterized protein n=1 Tax=Amycolatopsis ultiminotia TaxID=543629 RepID=A0ABP6Y1N4_9PSEU
MLGNEEAATAGQPSPSCWKGGGGLESLPGHRDRAAHQGQTRRPAAVKVRESESDDSEKQAAEKARGERP